MASSRSPSPNPSRHRTPEITSSNLRKSKEIPQRNNSLSKPSSPSPRASFEQKENVKARSKGSKNFMAPTISAASKAVPASPRKKILQERNEVISSSPNSIEFSIKEVGMNLEIEEIGSKWELGFGCQEVLNGGCELKKGESRIKQHKISPLPFVSPLDADPSLPPYDPKNNYLSPRPQFLHYRPNPRIEQYFNREEDFTDGRNGRRLEDSFSLESSDDDGSTILIYEKDSEEESIVSEVEEMETKIGETIVSEPGLKSVPSKRQPPRRSKLLPFLLVLAMACLFAPLADSPIISSSALRYQPLPRVFEGWNVRDYLAVTGANLNALASRFRDWSTDSTAYFASAGSFPKNDVGLYNVANVSDLAADETLDFYITHKPETEIEQLSAENLAEVPFAGHESEVPAVVKEDYGETDRSVNTENGGGKIEMGVYDDIKASADIRAQVIEVEVTEDMIGETSVRVEMEIDERDESVHSAEDVGIEDDKVKMVLSEDVKGEDTGAQGIEDEKVEMVLSEDVKEEDIAQGVEFGAYENLVDAETVGYEMEMEIEEDARYEFEIASEDLVDAEPVGYEMEMEMEEDARYEFEIEASHFSYETTHLEKEVETKELIRDEESISNVDNQSKFAEEHQISHGLELLNSINCTTLGLSIALLAIPATLAFLFMRQKRAPMVLEEVQTTKKIGTVSGSSETFTRVNGYASDHLPENEGMTGDSGAEVSSSWNNTSPAGRQQMKRGKEELDLSSERRLRRESAASSVSYGSFTTYERLSAKKGYKDEEVVTPVRRSSRIRNLVTSP